MAHSLDDLDVDLLVSGREKIYRKELAIFPTKRGR